MFLIDTSALWAYLQIVSSSFLYMKNYSLSHCLCLAEYSDKTDFVLAVSHMFIRQFLVINYRVARKVSRKGALVDWWHRAWKHKIHSYDIWFASYSYFTLLCSWNISTPELCWLEVFMMIIALWLPMFPRHILKYYD